MSDNPYLNAVHRNLPRLLAMMNQDQTDPYYGCADRQYWAWKLIDFPNGTFQGAVYGLAMLLEHEMLPDSITEVACLKRIQAMIAVLPKITDRHGALAEALPNEGSFCVTGLVLGDVLAALSVLKTRLSEQDYQLGLQYCTPLAQFLYKQDEEHGVISNHLASNALALFRWYQITGDDAALQRVQLWIQRIKDHACMEEGWMSEYGTADPGYQSWCLSALSQLDVLDQDDVLQLGDLIDKGYDFIRYFAMPDGSFSNAMGGRLTRFLLPGGLELRGDAALTSFARKGVAHHLFVTLDAIDPANMVPFFNDMVLAAVNFQAAIKPIALPHQEMTDGEVRHFQQAGLFCAKYNGNYAVISVRQGGRIVSDGHHISAYVGRLNRALYTTRAGRIVSQTSDQMIIQSDVIPVKRMMPSALKFIILRMLSLSVFLYAPLGNKIKLILAKLLVNPKPKPVGICRRTITLDTMHVSDEVKGITLTAIDQKDGFSPTHMASQGYWQRSDDC